MFDATKLLGGLLQGGLKGSGLGALGSGLGGVKGAVGLGLLGVAMEAFDHFSRKAPPGPGQGPPPPPGRTPTAISPPPPPGAHAAPTPPAGGGAAVSGVAAALPGREGERAAVLLVRAMIAAAAADGEIDPQERSRIMGRLEGQGLSEEERRFLQRELASPAEMESLAAAVDSPDLALQVYAASLMAITVDSPAEAAYLARLASRLRIDPDAVAALRAQLLPGA
jgi:uncharacterized membrane protein YebE (DUF533 family)